MRTHKVVDCIFQVDVAPQEVFLLGMGKGLAHQPTIALAGSQVIPFHVRGVDLGATPIGLQDAGDAIPGPKDDTPSYFNHPTPLTTLVHLRVA